MSKWRDREDFKARALEWAGKLGVSSIRTEGGTGSRLA